MPAFPFLKLPADLRVQVYRYLLHALYDICIDSSEAAKKRFWRHCQGNDLLENGMTYRDMYRVTAIGLHPAILSVNSQTYLESTKVLYSENRFSFYHNDRLSSSSAIAAVIPFLEDRSEGSRRLIREIEYLHYVTKFYPYPRVAEQDHVFAKTCDYLGQNLQLQHVTLVCVFRSTSALRTTADYKMYLANINKHDWMQRLVPLAQKLKTLALTGKEDGDADLTHAAQTYLDSRMAEASDTPCQIQVTQLGPRSVA